MDAVIYGTGMLGLDVFDKYRHKDKYNIKFFGDSDKSKWGKQIGGIEIKSPDYVVEYVSKNDCVLILASIYYAEIIENLIALGLNLDKTEVLCANINCDFLTGFRLIKNIPVTEEYCKPQNTGRKLKKVLFVQEKACARTLKLATCLKKRGIEVDHAFLREYVNDASKSLYGKVIRIESLNSFIDFVNDSDYDIIHCSNEPDYLSALLVNSVKKVVHDCHDMITLRRGTLLTNATFINEFIANKYCDGNLYVTDIVKNYAIHKYGLRNKPVFAINNYATEDEIPKSYKKKLSLDDGEIHCVYEGGLMDGSSNPNYHRCIEDKLLCIANAGIHVHFYGAFNKLDDYYRELGSKSPFLHNERYVAFNELAEELTRYDIGLALLNVNEGNIDFLSTTFPNKFFDYLMARLPVAATDIKPFNEFIAKYRCGVTLDFSADIKTQIKAALAIKIPETFLSDNGLLMERHIGGLIAFYEDVMGS